MAKWLKYRSVFAVRKWKRPKERITNEETNLTGRRKYHKPSTIGSIIFSILCDGAVLVSPMASIHPAMTMIHRLSLLASCNPSRVLFSSRVAYKCHIIHATFLNNIKENKTLLSSLWKQYSKSFSTSEIQNATTLSEEKSSSRCVNF